MRRTIFTKNEIHCENGICKMYLYNIKNKKVAYTVFNQEYLEEVKKYKWGLLKTGYAFNKINNILLHHLIVGKKKGYNVDHIDGKKLNNLKSNLRRVTHQQNCFNRTEKLPGICWDKSRNKWLSHLKINNRRVLSKRFDNIDEAVKARKEAEKKYFGEFACKNLNLLI